MFESGECIHIPPLYLEDLKPELSKSSLVFLWGNEQTVMLNQIFKQIKVNFAAKVKEKKDINKKFVIFCPTFYVIFVSNFVLRLFLPFWHEVRPSSKEESEIILKKNAFSHKFPQLCLNFAYVSPIFAT